MASANTDELFEADADIGARADAKPRSRSRHPQHGSVKQKPAIGAADHSVYEETPLLERDYNRPEDFNDGFSDDSSKRGAPEWSGARDFEGRPWWRKPSVGGNHL